MSHPARSQLGSLTIALACCAVSVVVVEISYRLSRLMGVMTSEVGLLSSMSIASLSGFDSFRGETVGEFSASLLLGFFTKEKFGRWF